MDSFTPLPIPNAEDGKPRLVGVEIEFAGLPEDRVASIVKETLGGSARQGDGPFWTIEDTAIGDLEVYLDTSLRKFDQSALRDELLKLGREVIPVEVVTDPIRMDQMPHLQDLVAALRQDGAKGSGAGVFFGFGIHFNIQIASDRVGDIHRPLLAYALIEDWLRSAMPIDETRRVLPFTDPYPTAFVRDLIDAGQNIELADLITLYLDHCASRNFGLDMLPIFAHFDPKKVTEKVDDSTSARPAFHFRLPDCRIDEAEWGLPTEWDRWVAVEKVAADDALLTRLGQEWQDDHGTVTLSRQSWAERSGAILEDAGISA